MITRFKSGPIRFTRGRSFYEVAHAHDGEGFIGLRDGRVVARGYVRHDIVRDLLAKADSPSASSSALPAPA